MQRRIGVIGSGIVGETLANGFLAKGHEVMRGTREPARLGDWRRAAGPAAWTGTFAETAAFGEIAVLAVKGTAAEAAVQLCGPDRLAGKIVIDTTNPIADAPPVKGILQYFTGPNESLMERLQALAPAARFVKAFSSVGSAQMVDPDYGGVRPTMFICGDDEAAKSEVTAILDRFGWEACDLGAVVGTRAIEPLAITWCAPGFLNNQWTHAFKLLTR